MWIARGKGTSWTGSLCSAPTCPSRPMPGTPGPVTMVAECFSHPNLGPEPGTTRDTGTFPAWTRVPEPALVPYFGVPHL